MQARRQRKLAIPLRHERRSRVRRRASPHRTHITRAVAPAREIGAQIRARSQQRRAIRNLPEPALLLLLRAVVGQLVAHDSPGVRYERSDDISLELQGEVEVRPRLVAVLEGRHAEDEVVDVFDVAVAFAFVAEAEDDAGDLDVGEGHVA